MDLEENVDVFYWFKCVHLCRPGVWVSLMTISIIYNREKYQLLDLKCKVNSALRMLLCQPV